MKQLFEWDELNLLRSEAIRVMALSAEERRKPEVRRRFCDYMEFVLCLVYAYGWKDAEEIVGIVPDKGHLDDICVNLEIANKTFRERTADWFTNENASAEELLRLIDTEAVRDYNTGVRDAGKASGLLGVKKTWHTMLDWRVRDSHQYLEGQTVGIDDLFYTAGGDSAMAPGGFDDPSENCNCRCYITLSK